MTQKIINLFILYSVLINPLQAQPNTDLFNYWQYYSDASNSLYKHFVSSAEKQLQQRNESINLLKTSEDWTKYQFDVRERLIKSIGEFPKKTPLNPEITGVINRKDVRVEKIVFQSQPGFYVTAALFLPQKKSKKSPAIIYCSGHTYLSFRSPVYQHVILNLVKKGFIVFAFDPIGQGERIEYDETDAPFLKPTQSTNQHSFPGAQCFIAGQTLANYMIWDGIRAVDYLLTRKEVDHDRIGITGRSGGGTQSAYIAAFDQRIQVAAPENYLTSFEQLLKSKGPQDAEQNFFQSLALGLDETDLIEVRAPKPMLIVSTTRDMFSIAGTRKMFNEAKQAYQIMDRPENLSMVEDDAGHESTEKNREATYSFFMHQFNMKGEPIDEEITPFTQEALQITRSGQVRTEFPDSKSVFDLNKAQLKKIINARESNPKDPKILRDAVKLWSGYVNQNHQENILFSGREQWNELTVERYLIVKDDGKPIPLVTVCPENERSGKIMIYLHPQGKKAAMADSAFIKALTDLHFTVILPDLSGIGELGPGYLKGDAYIDGVSYNQWFAGILTGKSIAGVQMEDLASIVNFCKRTFPNASTAINIIAKNYLTPLAMHFTALETAVQSLILFEPLASYQSIVEMRMYDPNWVPAVVPGALQTYDLPDLLMAIEPRKVLIINPVDGHSDPLDSQQIENCYNPAKDIYTKNNLKMNFQTSVAQESEVTQKILSWLTEL